MTLLINYNYTLIVESFMDKIMNSLNVNCDCHDHMTARSAYPSDNGHFFLYARAHQNNKKTAILLLLFWKI